MRQEWFPKNIHSFDTFVKLDYFFRRCHSEREFVKYCCEKLFYISYVNYKNEYICINNKFYVSLKKESMGSYTDIKDNSNKPIFSEFNYFGDLDIKNYKLLYDKCSIYYLFCNEYGLYPQNAINELFRKLNLKFQDVDRFKYDKINLYFRVNFNNYINFHDYMGNLTCFKISESSNKLIDIINCCQADIFFYQENYNFSPKSLYWYLSESGDIQYGVIYFANNSKVIKFPIVKIKTSVIPDTPMNCCLETLGKIEFLHPSPPYPLYNKDLIYNNKDKSIIIYPDEDYAQDIYFYKEEVKDEEKKEEKDKDTKKYIEHLLITTTWSGGFKETIADTDWDYLYQRKILIYIGHSIEHSRNAFEIYKILNMKDNEFIGFACPDYHNYSEQFDFYKKKSKYDREYWGEFIPLTIMDYTEFLTFVYKHHQKEFDTSVIKKSISLTELKANPPKTPQYLFEGLLRIGEQAMVFGPRAW